MRLSVVSSEISHPRVSVLCTHINPPILFDTLETKSDRTKSLFAKKAFGQLVPLGFDITAFTPAAYQRGRLPRPSKEISSWDQLRA